MLLDFVDSGLHIHSQSPFLSASPDDIVSCLCHGLSCSEIRCPYKCITKHLDELAESDKTFCYGVIMFFFLSEIITIIIKFRCIWHVQGIDIMILSYGLQI